MFYPDSTFIERITLQIVWNISFDLIILIFMHMHAYTQLAVY